MRRVRVAEPTASELDYHSVDSFHGRAATIGRRPPLVSGFFEGLPGTVSISRGSKRIPYHSYTQNRAEALSASTSDTRRGENMKRSVFLAATVTLLTGALWGCASGGGGSAPGSDPDLLTEEM